jgi:tetratricopeptide (TPR) repeat protein
VGRLMNEKAESVMPRWARVVVVVGLLAAVGVPVARKLGQRRTAPPRTAPSSQQRVLDALRARGDAAAERELGAACGRDPKPSCACVTAAAGYALDLDATSDATTMLDGAPGCTSVALKGMRAEVLARSGQLESALVEAAATLDQQPDERHALYAKALVAFKKGLFPQALHDAEAAAAQGRGAPAHVLAGLSHLRSGALDRARSEFEAALSADPACTDARYDVALVAQKQGRYRDAREGYLQTLSRDPKHADARYNLAILTNAEGARGEARHHYEKLKEIVPAGDPRLTNLEQLLASGGSGEPPALQTRTGEPSQP